MKEQSSAGRPGIKQIADALGISIGSVDRAIHGRPGVSPKTRDRVLKLAEKLNYRPNLAARNLKLNRHIRIGVFLPQQIASFFDPMRAGIRSASSENTNASIEVQFFSFPRLGEGDLKCMIQHQWHQFDGVILAPGSPAQVSEITGTLPQDSVPMVFVATDAARTPRLSSVAIEPAISGGIAAELLGQILRENRTVIAITGDLSIQDHSEKLQGFAAGLALHAPHLTLLPAIESHESQQDARRATRELLKRHPDLGGMYINTANSIPVLKAIEESGRLGRIRIIATDLFPELATYIEAGHVFASLNQRPFTQGRMAFELLSRYLIGGIAPKRRIRLAPHIVLRSNLGLLMDSINPDESED